LTPESTTESPSAATQAASPGGYRAKIRMYRQGLGDCFLISLPRKDKIRPYYVMIDCGVILGTPGAAAKMTDVVKNIEAVTQGEIDLLLATHEHWDHVSGFIQAQEAFEKLKVHEVWLSWAENDKDVLTQKLKADSNAALASLRMGLGHLQLAGADDAEELGAILEFFGAARGASTSDALDRVKKLTSSLRYCQPADAPRSPNGVEARFYVLGPPRDEAQLRKTSPSKRKKETYGLALEGLRQFLDGAATALTVDDPGRPFDRQFEIPFPQAATMGFFKQHYWQPGETHDEWRRIDVAWLGGTADLALQLDNFTNNTSLVVAIELPDGDVLLFAADAQVGNWLSWQGLSWTIGDRTVTGPDLLRRTIFYKVGHHGSHNATLKENGLELMQRLQVAMLPVDQDMAKKKRWLNMPLDELVTTLDDRTKGAVLRMDRPVPPVARRVVEDPLFIEVAL
jgi:hypothetical protein